MSGLDKAITGISGISEDESAIASSGPIAQTEVDASKLNDPDQHSVENPQPAGEPAGVRPGAAQATDFRFFIDSVSDKQIEGWIIRTEQPLRRCVVALREGDHILARAIASRFRADLTSAGIGDGLCCLRPPIASIGEDALNEEKRTARLLKELADAIAVLHVGWVNDNAHEEAERVDEDVALAPRDLLARIIALRVERGAPF